ncbi:MAG: nucleoside hydrolase [Pseudomonadota bacterium]
MFRAYITAVALLAASLLTACIAADHSSLEGVVEAKPSIIFDTDFGGDADDLGALAMLHYYADRDEINLLAVASWSNEEYALPALAAVNQYYGRPNLALGVRETEMWRTEWNYTKPIADQFPYDPNAVAKAKPAVTLYRELLADAAPQSITIITVGPIANIQNLLRSKPDQISDLSGAELVDAKVDRFLIMGGQFPDGITENGPEWNFDGNMPGVTQEVLVTLKRPVIFSGYEVGEALKYGSELNALAKDTPLYVGYKYFSAHAPWMKQDYEGAILDNSSFDQTAVMFAVMEEDSAFWTLSAPGRLTVDARGVGSWASDSNGPHRYLILSEETDQTIAHIATAMTH